MDRCAYKFWGIETVDAAAQQDICNEKASEESSDGINAMCDR